MNVRFNDIEAKFAVREGTYDEHIVNSVWSDDYYIRKNFRINPGDVVVDIGAHIGSFTILASLLGAKVIAYEPNKKNLELLANNILMNISTMPISVSGKAVGTKPGKATLLKSDKLEDGKLNTGAYYVGTGDGEQVGVVSMKRVLAKAGPVDFLKMDCEGCEYDILENTRLDRVKKIVVEYHQGSVKIERALRSQGFYIEKVRRSPENPDLGIIYALKR